MGKLRVLSGADVCDILRRSGFHEVRQQGSHSIMQRKLENGGTITVPVPMHRTLRRGTSASIVRQPGLAKALFDPPDCRAPAPIARYIGPVVAPPS
ncbi:MAG: addiction module toxin, HicA family [Acidobacteria bacterium]|nr:addiction module toxin, HicA family [Acidobacteriota bacterium]